MASTGNANRRPTEVRFRVREYDIESSDTGTDFWLTEEGVLTVETVNGLEIVGFGVAVLILLGFLITVGRWLGVMPSFNVFLAIPTGMAIVVWFCERRRRRLRDCTPAELRSMGRLRGHIGWDQIETVRYQRGVVTLTGGRFHFEFEAKKRPLVEFLRAKLGPRFSG